MHCLLHKNEYENIIYLKFTFYAVLFGNAIYSIVIISKEICNSFDHNSYTKAVYWKDAS